MTKFFGSMDGSYNRTCDLIKKVNDCAAFLMSEVSRVGKFSLSIDNLVRMKYALSDINNTLTLLSTKAAGRLIADAIGMPVEDRQRLFDEIDLQKPNTNGFDIRIDSRRIIVEVKCNVTIDGKKLVSAQINSILDDARKLRLEAERNKKAKNSINGCISEYTKILAIVNLGSIKDEELIRMITKDILCREGTNERRKERMKVKKYLCALTNLKELNDIVDKEKVYVIVLHKGELDKELSLCR